uniref:Uncharacterized protein n=1 Tax=Arundo donax TaxID=35708 RepID=A0A0A9DZR1_ARUDO
MHAKWKNMSTSLLNKIHNTKYNKHQKRHSIFTKVLKSWIFRTFLSFECDIYKMSDLFYKIELVLYLDV